MKKYIKIFFLTAIAIIPAINAKKNFILIAAPGSGKGSFSQYMSKEHNYIQICPGDIFRHEIKEQTELGKKIQSTVERGDYIDENLVCEIMANYIEKALAENKNFILDGFPRSDYSFAFLDNFLKNQNLKKTIQYVQLIADDATCINRIIYRQFCSQCFMVYHKIYAQPKNIDVCDSCTIPLSIRKADTEIEVRKRLSYFHSKIEPLVKKAQESYDCINIETKSSFEELKKIYKNLTQ